MYGFKKQLLIIYLKIIKNKFKIKMKLIYFEGGLIKGIKNEKRMV